MENIISSQILFLADLIIFTTVVLIHLTKKNVYFIYLYAVQSLVVTFLMAYSAFIDHSLMIGLLAVLIFVIKVIVAPIFFLKLIKAHTLNITSSNYLNLPFTLVVIAIITTMAHSKFFQPLASLAPANENALLISIAAMFISLFIIINRKGALSQMIGILSIENAIVSFALAAGLEQGFGLELGITFDIFAWIVIASVFVSMIYKKFNTLDVSVMTKLKG